MIGMVHDFENLIFTSFPTTFDPLDLTISVLLLLFLLDSASLLVDFFPSFSAN